MPGERRAVSVWPFDADAGTPPDARQPRAGRDGSRVIARLVRSDDFERVLRTRAIARSTHFAVHHLPERAGVCARRPKPHVLLELSTSAQEVVNDTVDDSSIKAASVASRELWLGAVVPKRHARRAVTRTLLKRQIRAAVHGHSVALAAGLWVVRLRAPFERSAFVSAASNALRCAARSELEDLMRSAGQSVAGSLMLGSTRP